MILRCRPRALAGQEDRAQEALKRQLVSVDGLQS